MYIDTRGKESMEESIYQILDINSNQLDELLEDCHRQYQDDHQVFILDDQYDFFLEYVKKHLVRPVDKVMFVHLSRRLDDDQDDNGYNLVNVLTKETSLSRYLRKYGITFKYDQKLKVYVDGNVVDLDHDEYGYEYLKQRFNYYNDYSIGGYAFGDALKDSDFYEAAFSGPELFGYLYLLNENDDAIIDEFINNSTLYQYEYLINIEDIYFNNYDELTNLEKQYHILVKVLQRLYFYKYDPDFNKNDNVAISMVDNSMIKDKYLIRKAKV